MLVREKNLKPTELQKTMYHVKKKGESSVAVIESMDGMATKPQLIVLIGTTPSPPPPPPQLILEHVF